MKKGIGTKPYIQTDVKPVSYIPVTIFKDSLKHYSENNFVHFLTKQFGFEVTKQLVSRYFVGTSKYWNGATVFWQIDNEGRIRTGKIMLYGTNTGRRSKEPYHTPNWVHEVLNLPEFSLQQCFFGEHLLKGNIKPVAICESEKTAIIASVYLPQFLWLACGCLNGLNFEKCKVLQDTMV